MTNTVENDVESNAHSSNASRLNVYDFETDLSCLPPNQLFSFDDMRYVRSKPPSATRRLSDRWKESLIFHLKFYRDQREPIEIHSTSMASGFPLVDTVLVTELSPAKITVKKLLSNSGIKEVSYPYDTVYGISKPKKERRLLAVINMKRCLNLIPANQEHVPSSEELRSDQRAEKKGSDFEVFLGLSYERFGHIVGYNGIKKGKDDEGIDLIAHDVVAGITYLVQAKNRHVELEEADAVRMIRNFEAFSTKHFAYSLPVKIFAHTGPVAPYILTKLYDAGILSRQFTMPSQFRSVKCIERDGERFHLTRSHPDFYTTQIALYDVGFLVDSAQEAIELGFPALLPNMVGEKEFHSELKELLLPA